MTPARCNFEEMNINKAIISVLLIASFTSCNFNKNVNAILGKNGPQTAAGEYLEYTVGGSTGESIKKYMQKQVDKMEDSLVDAKAKVVNEGILLTFGTTCSFPAGSAEVSDNLKKNLRALKKAAKDYEETEIIIEGHADSTGSREDNLRLSSLRGKAVAAYLEEEGLDKYRMNVISYGEDTPRKKKKKNKNILVYDRRVEIVIIATRKLRILARNGDV